MPITFDQWKTQSPWDDEKENYCLYCGEPCDGMYCCDDHKKADLN